MPNVGTPSKSARSDRPTLRHTQKEQTRKVLLAQAYALFEELGFERATMRDLAQRSGVALGTIFKHFPDKHALLGAAFREVIAKQTDRAFATLPAGDLRPRLLHITRRFYRFYAARTTLARVLIKEIPLLAGPEGSAVTAQSMEFLQRIGGLYVEAINKGELQSDTDLIAAVAAYWSFYIMGLMAGLIEPRFDVDKQIDLVDRMLRQHLRGLAPAAVPKKGRR